VNGPTSSLRNHLTIAGTGIINKWRWNLRENLPENIIQPGNRAVVVQFTVVAASLPRHMAA
jgi:hypothetical protein